MEIDRNLFTKIFVDPWNGNASLLFTFVVIVIIFTPIAETLTGNLIFSSGLVENTGHNFEYISAPFGFYASICLWRCCKNTNYSIFKWFARIFSVILSYFWIYPLMTLLIQYSLIDLKLLHDQNLI
jgi:hypothetical protein